MALDLAQRLELDALVSASDLAELAYRRLAGRLSEIADTNQLQALDRDTMSELALYAWAVVDNLHLFVSFMHRLNIAPGGRFEAFRDQLAIATRLRNRMDHRPSNVRNLARRTGDAEPVYGVLQFVWGREDGLWSYQQVTLGTMQHNKHSLPFIDTHAPAPKRGLRSLELAAFDERANLTTLVEELADGIARLNEVFEQGAMEHLRNWSAANGHQLEDVLKERAGGSFRIAYQFSPAPDETS